MRLVMMGTGPFAVPTFEALCDSAHEVAVVVARPPRGRRSPPSPMLAAAEARDTPIWTPETVNAPAARAKLTKYRADLLVVCDYGEILRPETLAVARLGGVNLHGSLLPKYRGAAPVQWAVYHGEKETGATVIQMTPRLDAGPCIGQVRTPIDPDETAGELETRLARLGATLTCRVIGDLAAGRATVIQQDPRSASKAPRLKKSDGRVDWSRAAAAIRNQVRAMQPWPGSYTWWHHQDREPLRLILRRVEVVQQPPHVDTGHQMPSPGIVLSADERFTVACGDGALDIVELQPAGRRVQSAAEFLRGHAVAPGDVLGDAE